MSDDGVHNKPATQWERWVTLGAAGAILLSHQETAEHIGTRSQVSDWWTQMVNVGDERISRLA